MLQLPEEIVSLYAEIKPAYRKVYVIIRAAVLSGQLDSTRHLTEEAIAEALHISRTPVRAALAQLKEEGILQVSTKSAVGARQLSKTDKINLLFMDELLESTAAFLAASRATEDSIDILTELNDAMKDPNALGRSGLGVRGIRDLHLQFHLMIARMSGNTYLYEEVVKIRNIMRQHRAADTVTQAYPGSVTPFHDRIILAFRDCSPEDARLWMQADIRISRDIYLQSKIV